MKFEIVDEKRSKVFINDIIISTTNLKNEKELEKFLKNIILSLKNRYNVILKGLYEIDIFINKKIGALVEIEKIEAFMHKEKDVDLKIKVVFDCDFYFKTEDYFLISGYKDVYYYKNYFYIKLKNLKNVSKYIEFGEIIFGNDLLIEEKGIKIRKKQKYML